MTGIWVFGVYLIRTQNLLFCRGVLPGTYKIVGLRFLRCPVPGEYPGNILIANLGSLPSAPQRV